MKRNTWQREAVREALSSNEGFVSAQTLHSSLRETGSSIGLATVYRALADLGTSGEADSLQSDQGEALYRACTPGQHHHHLICIECGAVEDVAAPAGLERSVHSAAEQIARSTGFRTEHHRIDLLGRCKQCA